jgi:hypothetical protein
MLDKSKQIPFESSIQSPASSPDEMNREYWQKHLEQKFDTKFKILAYKDT